ncbi:MAG: Ig domain-containing protein, partial [Planctomycetota bacterium]|nr:Ig domain-containing protein [Planctomycetota bacterium]
VDPKDYTDPVILTGELPPAVLGAPYMVQLQTAGGVISHTYSLLDSDKDNLPPGLVLTKEGLIIGKPSTIPAATLPFTVKVTDGVNRYATKQFTIPVGKGQLGGDLMLHKGRFRLDFSRVNNDRLDLIMFLNDRNLADREELEGYKFQLFFGRFRTEELELTRKGIYRAINPQTKGETLIKIRPKLGRIKVKVSNTNLIDPLQATEAGYDDPLIPIRVALAGGDGSFSVMAIETARFDYDRTTSVGIGRFDVRDQETPGGVFFLTRCVGRIDKDRNDRDTLRLAISGYARAPGGASAAPRTSDEVDVRVGDFQQVITGPSFRFKGSATAQMATYSAPGSPKVRKLVVGGASRKFHLVTGPILTAAPPGVTPVPDNFGFSGQIPPGVEVVVPVYIKVYLGGDPSFEGQASIGVFRKGNALGPDK